MVTFILVWTHSGCYVETILNEVVGWKHGDPLRGF